MILTFSLGTKTVEDTAFKIEKVVSRATESLTVQAAKAALSLSAEASKVAKHFASEGDKAASKAAEYFSAQAAHIARKFIFSDSFSLLGLLL